MDVQNVPKISNMAELVRIVEMSKNLPCEDCRLFYFSQKWFDLGAGDKAVSEELDSLESLLLDERKGLKEGLKVLNCS